MTERDRTKYIEVSNLKQYYPIRRGILKRVLPKIGRASCRERV